MPRNLSEDEVAEFRQRLCAAAERLFVERGVDGVSMRQLAQELGCSATTPYRYFRDKDEILASVRAAAHNRFADALEAALQTGKDARAKAAAVGEAYIRFAFTQPNAYKLMFDMSQPDEARFPDLAAAGKRSRRTMTAYVKNLVAEGMLTGDPELLGVLFWAAIHGLVVLRLAGKLPAKPDFPTLHREMMQRLARAAAPASDAFAVPQPRSSKRQSR